MRRREFIAGLSGAVAWPVVARAQQVDRVRRVGVLMNGAATEGRLQSYLELLVLGLRQLGWTEGQNLRIETRWNAGDADLARTYAAQLIGLMPDVILAVSTTNLGVIRQATNTIPIVFVQVSDPVAQGFVTNMTQPGGNITGFTMYEFSIGTKWIDLLKEIAPDLTRVAVMFNPETSPQSKFFVRSIEAAAPSFNVQVSAAPVRTTGEIESVLQTFAQKPNGGVILPTDTFTRLRGPLIGDLASRYRIPTLAASPDFIKEGGLMYYGVSVNLNDHFRQAATYIDRIFKGAKAGDLPIQRPNKYTLAINLKVAKTLGLKVPLPLLGLADEVIE